MENLENNIDREWKLYVKTDNIKNAIMLGSCLLCTVGGLIIDKYLFKGNGYMGIAAGAIASLPLSMLGHSIVNSYYIKNWDLELDKFDDD
jgi:hypothetical protein